MSQLIVFHKQNENIVLLDVKYDMLYKHNIDEINCPTKTHKNDDGFLIPRTKKTKPRNPNPYKQDTETIKQGIAGGKKGTLTGCFRRCILYRDRDCSCNPKYEG